VTPTVVPSFAEPARATDIQLPFNTTVPANHAYYLRFQFEHFITPILHEYKTKSLIYRILALALSNLSCDEALKTSIQGIACQLFVQWESSSEVELLSNFARNVIAHAVRGQ
jgi:hypothetical protein